MSNLTKYTLLIALLTLFTSCGGEEMSIEKVQLPNIKDVPPSAWEKLSTQKIYFGHQSVGFNIIEGIKDVMKENPQIKLNIVETYDPSDFETPIFAHSRVGKNMDPTAKIDAFEEFMAKGLGGEVDYAFFKFCYVDVTSATNVSDVFKEYKDALARLRESHPKTNFVHFTVPLTTIQTGIKVPIKKLIGRPVGGYEENIKRTAFNELLSTEYSEKEPLFDLAKIESTTPDGSRGLITRNGKRFYSLVPEYTNDGGHLNEKGRKIVAEQLLIFLAELAEK